MYFRQFFLKSMYFSSCKIPENLKSASLTVLNEVLPYTGYTMTLCMQKVFIATYICLYDNSHICCLWPEKDPTWFWGTKENIKLAAWTLHRFSAMKLNHSLSNDDRWYPNSCCQWHADDLSDSLIKDIRWKVMVILWYWTLHRFHTQTLQSSRLDWWYFLHWGNDFWLIYTDFGVKIWPVKVRLRV